MKTRVLPEEASCYSNSYPSCEQLLEKKFLGQMDKQKNLAQPGIITPRMIKKEFSAAFLDQDYCTKWVIKKLHHDSIHCAWCGYSIEDISRTLRFYEGKKIRCPHCSRYSTGLTGTFLSGTNLTYQKIVLMLLLLACLDSNQAVASLVNQSAVTVRAWRRKFELIEALTV